MRGQIKKLTKGHSTRSERKFLELLKKHRVPFQAKIKIAGREIDFLIGRYAIEIDAHAQDVSKNSMLYRKGYTPIHFNNWEIGEHLGEWLQQICQEQIF